MHRGDRPALLVRRAGLARAAWLVATDRSPLARVAEAFAHAAGGGGIEPAPGPGPA